MLPNWLRQFGRYLRAVGRHAGAMLTGVVGWLAQEAFGSFPWLRWLKPGSVIAGLFVAQYLAWRDSENQRGQASEPIVARGLQLVHQIPGFRPPGSFGLSNSLTFTIESRKPLNGQVLRMIFDNQIFLPNAWLRPAHAKEQVGQAGLKAEAVATADPSAILFRCPTAGEPCLSLEGRVESTQPIKLTKIDLLKSGTV